MKGSTWDREPWRGTCPLDAVWQPLGGRRDGTKAHLRLQRCSDRAIPETVGVRGGERPRLAPRDPVFDLARGPWFVCLAAWRRIVGCCWPSDRGPAAHVVVRVGAGVESAVAPTGQCRSCLGISCERPLTHPVGADWCWTLATVPGK
jgi:hypothetical protein